MARGGSIPARAALLAFGVAVALLGSEAVLRVAGIGYPSFYQPDPVTAAALRPGAEGWFRKEGEAYVRISSAGLRDREHVREKPPGTLRVAVLGDSYAEAFQIPQEDAFWAVAERELAACPGLGGRSVEFLNFGVSGFGTAQELLQLRHEAWGWSPDVVVLAFLTGNDFRNNVRALEKDERPYFVVRDDQLVLDDSFLRSPVYSRLNSLPWRIKDWIVAHSRVVQLVYQMRVVLQARELERTEIQPEAFIYRPPDDPVWEQAWDVTEHLIRQMNDEVRAHGASFQLLILTNNIQVNPDPAARAAFLQRPDVKDLLYPDRRLEAFAQASGIPVLALVDAFRAEAEARGVCLHGFPNAVPCGGHWNAEGHRLGGHLLAARLCERLSSGELGGTSDAAGVAR